MTSIVAAPVRSRDLEPCSPGRGGRHLSVDRYGDELLTRFWSKVDIGHPLGCWQWTAGKVKGHGRFWFEGRDVQAHRFAYELLVGPIPDGLDCDHLCRNRACVNPDHVEPVTRGENVLRGESPTARAHRFDRCGRGHPLTRSNTYVSASGDRTCRTCSSERHRLLSAASRGAVCAAPAPLSGGVASHGRRP